MGGISNFCSSSDMEELQGKKEIFNLVFFFPHLKNSTSTRYW